MRKKMQRDALRKIAEIRALQLASAEALAERAQSALVKENEKLELRKAELGKVEEDWRDMVCRPVLMLETMAFWAQAVQQRTTQFVHAREMAGNAAADQRQAVGVLYLAKQNVKTAEARAKDAGGYHLQSLEEKTLHEMADRHLQHGRKQ